MAHTAIEYMIMIPVLIAQIFLFPLAADAFMSVWVSGRRTLELENSAILLGSIAQQLYLSMNRAAMPTGNASYIPHAPPLIEDKYYTGNATLQTASEGGPDSGKILQVNLFLAESDISASASVVLGNNAIWLSSTFISNSNSALIGAEKFSNGTICLWFEG